MWKVLRRVVNADEMRAIIGWFVASAILQGVTLALMIPFLRALYGHHPSLRRWLIAVLAVGLVTVVVDIIAFLRSYRVSVYEVCDTMIDRVAEHVLTLPLGWFTARREAGVINATSREVNTLSHLSSLVVPSLCNAFITPLVMLVAVAFVEWPLALIMAVTIVPLYLIWRLMSSATTRCNELEDQAAAAAAGRLVEFARLQPVLRATGVTQVGWTPVREVLEADSKATLEGLRIKGRPAQGFTWVVYAAFALVLAVGLSAVSGHRLDVIAYLAVATVTARMLLPLTKAALYSTESNAAMVALRSVAGILDAQPLTEPAPEQVRQPDGTTVELRDVSFEYEEGRPVLDRVSLRAEEGLVTALVGPSGAGKSTILRLVARFWDVSGGSVTIGGVDVRQLPATEVMTRIAMVFQEVYLFDSTIQENLRLAKPDATDEELEEAARRASLQQVIAELPQGWQTPVGPGGVSLSGGERQRVAIARAFLKDAPILLLDEVTSALDGENESAITEVIRELSTGRTVLVVAHRLTTIQRADQVIFLEPGPHGVQVRQSGTVAELARQEGPLRGFVEAYTSAARWKL